MFVNIVCKFSCDKEVCPIRLMEIAEGTKILFQFLVDTLSLAICLGMISRTETLFNPKGLAQSFGEFCSKLRSSVER